MVAYKENSEEVILPKSEEELEEFNDELADKVLELFIEAKDYRASTQIMGHSIDYWIERLYNAYNKIHESEELKGRPNMNSYFGLVQIKTNIVASYMRQKFASQASPPFNILPTPIVELPQNKQKQALESVKAKLLNNLISNGIPAEAITENGFIMPEVAKYIDKAAKEAKATLREEEYQIASEATGKMQQLIKDQLVDSKFSLAMSEGLIDVALMPLMILALDNVSRSEYKWKNNKYIKETTIQPTFRRVDPSNAYFSPDSTSAQDGSYFIELLKRSKAELSGFIGKKEAGYDDEAIKCAIESEDQNWLGMGIDSEATEDNSSLFFGNIDKSEVLCLRCQTLISGKLLIEYGVKLKESQCDEYFNADIEVCNSRVIRCQIVTNPHGDRTYFSASYKRVAGDPYGISAAMMVYDRQLSMNRTQYSMLLNADFSAGPMVEINADSFDMPQDVTMKPFTRVFSNPARDASKRGITQHTVTPTFPMLYQFLTNQLRLADDECGLPSFLNGNPGVQGAGSTLGGFAMMTDNAVMGLEDCAFNIDEYIIKPAITLLYARNMVGNDDSVKSDAKVIATGLLGMKQDLNRSKELAGLIPQAGQLQQQGAIPKEMYDDLVRDYFKSEGFDTDKYINSSGVQSEINQVQANSPVAQQQLDGRSLKAMQ